MISIVDSEGATVIKLDDIDSKKDVIIKDGKEISLIDEVKNISQKD